MWSLPAAARAVGVEWAAPRTRRQVLRRNCFERNGRNAEHRRKRTIADIVLLHRQQVVAREQLHRQQLHRPGLQVREAAGHWLCDTGKARRQLGVVPCVGLRKGADVTVKWYREAGWLQ